MSKSQDAKKTIKKEALKSPKEKKRGKEIEKSSKTVIDFCTTTSQKAILTFKIERYNPKSKLHGKQRNQYESE